MLTSFQIIFRLLLSVVLCGVIGLEREYRNKPAGLRTNILVGMGSTLIMMTSVYVAESGMGDPGRIAAGVVTGIGFLGGGVIIRERRREGTVHGITTATTIWIVSAIGLAIGLGFYLPAIFTALITLIVLYVLNSEKIREKLAKG